jgi:hypothetical protein
MVIANRSHIAGIRIRVLFVQRTVLAAVGSDSLKGRGLPTDEVITACSSGPIKPNNNKGV